MKRRKTMELMACFSRMKRRKTSSSSSSSQELMASSSRMKRRKATTGSSSSQELISSDEEITWEKLKEQAYKQEKRARGMGIDAFNKVKKYTKLNATTGYEYLRLLLLSHQKIQEKVQAMIDDFQRLYHENPHLWRYRMISSEDEFDFKHELFFAINQVKFTNDMMKCDKLKYDTSPATIAAVAEELFDKYPLKTECLARNLVKDRVQSLREIFRAERKLKLQEQILLLEFIPVDSDTCDLKSLKEQEGFRNFKESEIYNEITEYNWFIAGYKTEAKAREDYRKHIVDTYDTITKQAEKPYSYGNSYLNLAEQVIRGDYVIQDVKEEILKIRFKKDVEEILKIRHQTLEARL